VVFDRFALTLELIKLFRQSFDLLLGNRSHPPLILPPFTQSLSHR
jgi:hypothetical protein